MLYSADTGCPLPGDVQDETFFDALRHQEQSPLIQSSSRFKAVLIRVPVEPPGCDL